MTAKELAELLNGRDDDQVSVITKDEEQQAKASGLVVVYGFSDDCMEFGGAIHDEVSCYGGGVAHLNEGGLYDPGDSCPCYGEGYDECKYLKAERERCKKIEAVWCGDTGAAWAYRTDIPHETFKVMESGELYCIGIVFLMDALKGKDGGQ